MVPTHAPPPLPLDEPPDDWFEVGTRQDPSTLAVQPLPPSWSRGHLRRQRPLLPGAGDGVAVLFEVPPTRPLTVFPRVLVTPPRSPPPLLGQEPRRPSTQLPDGAGVAVGDEVVVFVVVLVVVVDEDDGDGLTVAAALAFGDGVEHPMNPRMQPVLGRRGVESAVPVSGAWECGWGRGMPRVSTPLGISKTCVPVWHVTGSAVHTC